MPNTNEAVTLKDPVTGKLLFPATVISQLYNNDGTPWTPPEPVPGATVVSATLLASGWAQGSDDRYYQTINVTGVTTDIAQLITVDVNLLNTDIDEKIAIITAWNGPAANECVQGNGTLTFYSYEEPAVDIPIYVGVH